MKTLISVALIVVGVLTTAPSSLAAPYNPTDEVRINGEWKLVTVVFHKGSIDQKVVGKIEFGGKEVIGEKDHCITTPFGRYVWRGDYTSPHLAGWIALDSDMDIKEPIPAKIDSSNSQSELHTRKISSQPAAPPYGEP